MQQGKEEKGAELLAQVWLHSEKDGKVNVKPADNEREQLGRLSGFILD